jgi:pyridoxine/pyridoxamine 5'-phosphate oxidase
MSVAAQREVAAFLFHFHDRPQQVLICGRVYRISNILNEFFFAA